MARDTFDNVPQGLRRSRKGWLQVASSPQDAKVRRLQEQNDLLRQQVDEAMRRLTELEASRE